MIEHAAFYECAINKVQASCGDQIIKFPYALKNSSKLKVTYKTTIED